MSEGAVREISYVQAIREALDEEMARDERVFIMGQDVGAYGGVFSATRGLFKKYGINSTVSKGASWAAIRDALSNGDIHPLSTKHVNPLLPVAALSYPCGLRVRMVAFAEMPAGAALRASAISARRSGIRYSSRRAIRSYRVAPLWVLTA